MQNNWLQMSVLMTHSPKMQVWRMCCGSSCVQYVLGQELSECIFGFILTRIEYIYCQKYLLDTFQVHLSSRYVNKKIWLY